MLFEKQYFSSRGSLGWGAQEGGKEKKRKEKREEEEEEKLK